MWKTNVPINIDIPISVPKVALWRPQIQTQMIQSSLLEKAAVRPAGRSGQL